MATRRMFSIQKIAVSSKLSIWKIFSICSLALLAFCSVASAQTKSLLPGIEVFGGYSHLSFSSKGLGFANWTEMNGWNVAITLPHIYKDFGITADASGGYAPAVEQFVYMIGPQYKWEFSRFRFVAHGLYGRAQTRLLQPGSTFTGPSDRQRALAFGGELDIPISDRISIRAVQADYLVTKAFGGDRNNVRISTGLIFRFGKH